MERRIVEMLMGRMDSKCVCSLNSAVDALHFSQGDQRFCSMSFFLCLNEIYSA